MKRWLKIDWESTAALAFLVALGVAAACSAGMMAITLLYLLGDW